MTWAGNGELETDLYSGGELDPSCWSVGWESSPCNPYVVLWQTRAATASGTVTDSEWGTFILDGASGSMWQRLN
jgi:hypothetical protein